MYSISFTFGFKLGFLLIKPINFCEDVEITYYHHCYFSQPTHKKSMYLCEYRVYTIKELFACG